MTVPSLVCTCPTRSLGPGFRGRSIGEVTSALSLGTIHSGDCSTLPTPGRYGRHHAYENQKEQCLQIKTRPTAKANTRGGNKKTRLPESLRQVNLNAAGIDVHPTELWVAITFRPRHQTRPALRHLHQRFGRDGRLVGGLRPYYRGHGIDWCLLDSALAKYWNGAVWT